ncbi:Type I restriction modification DNA specificity domain protein [compost metagenome]
MPFSLAVKDATSEYSKLQKSEYLEQGRFPIVDQGQQKFGGYTDDESVVSLDGCPAIVFGDHTRIFKFINEPFCLGADGAKVLEPKAELDKKFLFYYLSSLDIESAGYSRHFKYLKENVVPVPPLPEQKRIAAILDKADAIRRKRQQAIQLADDFLRAVFLDMFGDPVTNPKGWNIRPIKEMAKVTTGNTPPRDKPEYYGDFIEWIKSDNINTPSDFLTVATEYLSEAGCMVGRRVPAGSTLLTCIAGSFDCIGNSAYADREVSFNQQINALTPMPGVNGIFLYALCKYCKKAIQAASTGGMKGMVSKGKLEEVRFICPPESMQQKFAEAFHRYQGLRTGMENSQDGLSDEFSSISQKAFSGHL